MAKIRCEKVDRGLRSSEVLASITDMRGRTHFIRVERDFLTGNLLPVGIIGEDRSTGAWLIELPHEAETGANRLWVARTQLDEIPTEAFT